MTSLLRAAMRAVIVIGMVSCSVALQAQQAQPAPESGTAASNLWLVGGGAFVTVRNGCQTCEEEFPYRHGPGILAGAGYRVNQRMDVGGELFWVPISTESGQKIHVTHMDAVAQFRPWASQGFFLKGGAGMAFVRNWIDGTGGVPFTSKALSVVIGGGWAFRPAERFGVQLFATQHAVALGDIETSGADIQDVLGNFWSVGIGIVIR